MPQLDIAILGAGAIGRAHGSLVRPPSEATRLGAIVDPEAAARPFAASLSIPWFADLPAMPRVCRPDGAIVAAPNHTHAPLTTARLDHGVPTLEEKPLAPNLAARGFDVEDTAAVTLRLVIGALATLTLSDAAPSPRNGYFSSRESAVYPLLPARAGSQAVCGAEASPTPPHLQIRRHAGPRDWREPLQAKEMGFAPGDPYRARISHFVREILAEEAPRDAPATLRATPAVRASAQTGATINLS